MDVNSQLAAMDERINGLKEIYDQLAYYVAQQEVVYWSIIIGVFIIVGTCLYFIARNAVDKGIKRGIKELQNDMQKLRNEFQSKLDRKADKLEDMRANWHPIVYSNGTEGNVSFTKLGDFVLMQGTFKIKRIPVQSVLATIPVSFRPLNKLIKGIYDTVFQTMLMIEIEPSGYIKIIYIPGTGINESAEYQIDAFFISS